MANSKQPAQIQDSATALDRTVVQVDRAKTVAVDARLKRYRSYRLWLLKLYAPFVWEKRLLELLINIGRRKLPYGRLAFERMICSLDGSWPASLGYDAIADFERRWNVYLTPVERGNFVRLRVEDDEYELGMPFLAEQIQRLVLTAVQQPNRLRVVDLEIGTVDARDILGETLRGVGSYTPIGSRRRHRGTFALDPPGETKLKFRDAHIVWTVGQGGTPADAAVKILTKYEDGRGPLQPLPFTFDRRRQRSSESLRNYVNLCADDMLIAQQEGKTSPAFDDWQKFRNEISRRWDTIRSVIEPANTQG